MCGAVEYLTGPLDIAQRAPRNSTTLDRIAAAPSVIPDLPDNLPVLVLGGSPPDLADIVWSTDARSPFSAIVLLDRAGPADLAAVLDSAEDPALPIADFSGAHYLRHDFTAAVLDRSSVADMKRCFSPIWRRLGDLPFHADLDDRADLIILRLAYSRASAIEARFAADSTLLVEYPLLGRSADLRRRLEAMADCDLLRRTHFTRTHVCGKCNSSRLHTYEACPDCGGSDLHDEAVVHHYSCGWQEPESRFVQDHQLVCPKCRHELRHYGVDYDKPGVVAVCHGCGVSNSEPVVNFACLDCSAVTGSEDATAIDWYHYHVTEEGLRALQEGRLPNLHVESMLNGHSRAFSAREFRLMALASMKVAQRYDRPFAIARLWVDNLDALIREHGRMRVHSGFQLAIDVIVETLADSDFVTADDDSAFLIAFPETAGHDAASVMERLTRTLAEKVALPFDLKARIAERGAAAELVPEG